MTIEEMIQMRNSMMDEVQTLIDSGEDNNINSANDKMEEIKALDIKIEDTIKAKKNAEALAHAAPAVSISSKSGVSAENFTPEGAALIMDGVSDNAADTNEKNYEKAWAHIVMGVQSAEDRQIVQAYNAAMSTANSGILIPTTVTKGIWSDISESHPFWADTAKTYVKGDMEIIREKESTDAKWYDEPTPIEEGMESFDKISLKGCELARDITVTWKLKAMAIEEFIPYIRRRMSEKMGAACGYGVTRGRGKPGSSDTFKEEPLGIITALEAETGTPQIITSSPAGDELDSALIKANGLIASKYASGAAIYVNNSTLWNRIAVIKDAANRNIFMADAHASNGVGRIYGRTVKIDSDIPDGYILYGNAKCYHVNINQNITLDTEDHKKERLTDYIGYAIVDGIPVTTKGFALIKISDTAVNTRSKS